MSVMPVVASFPVNWGKPFTFGAVFSFRTDVSLFFLLRYKWIEASEARHKVLSAVLKERMKSMLWKKCIWGILLSSNWHTHAHVLCKLMKLKTIKDQRVIQKTKVIYLLIHLNYSMFQEGFFFFRIYQHYQNFVCYLSEFISTDFWSSGEKKNSAYYYILNIHSYACQIRSSNSSAQGRDAEHLEPVLYYKKVRLTAFQNLDYQKLK